jgi:transcriptional regulator GlxA family with amidase domain
MKNLSRLLCALAFLMAGPRLLPAGEKLTPPQGASIRVAVVLTDGATMIDFAGPWEVFQDVGIPGIAYPVFELYTVSDSTKPIRTSAGMTVLPQYSFKDAPPPQVVVVGAQAGRTPEMLEWLRQQANRADVLMSVCTGASKLAAAGLLDGKQAATHHDFVDLLHERFPRVQFLRSKRFVQSDPVILTAGGLTSGIDAALHVVERYFGRDIARRTANYMEYEGPGWQLE